MPGLAAARGYRLRARELRLRGRRRRPRCSQPKGCSRERPGRAGGATRGRTQPRPPRPSCARTGRRTALVTVSIGGNDVTACAQAPETVAVRRAGAADGGRQRARAARRLRRAAGPRVRIVGTTYPDVLLGLYAGRRPGRAAPRHPRRHGLQDVHHPTLESAYAAAGGRLGGRHGRLRRLHPAQPDDDAAPRTAPCPWRSRGPASRPTTAPSATSTPRTDGYRLIAAARGPHPAAAGLSGRPHGTHWSSAGVTCSSWVMARGLCRGQVGDGVGEAGRVGAADLSSPPERSITASTTSSATWMPLRPQLERRGLGERAHAERAGRPQPAAGHRRGAPSRRSPGRPSPGRPARSGSAREALRNANAPRTGIADQSSKPDGAASASGPPPNGPERLPP